MKKSICSLHSAERTISKSSTKIAMSSDSAAIPSTILGSTAVSMSWLPAAMKPAISRAMTQPAWSRAAAMCVHNRTGSLSEVSSEIQATAATRGGSQPLGSDGGFAVSGRSGDQCHQAPGGALQFFEKPGPDHPLGAYRRRTEFGFQHGVDRLFALALVSLRQAAHLGEYTKGHLLLAATSGCRPRLVSRLTSLRLRTMASDPAGGSSGKN